MVTLTRPSREIHDALNPSRKSARTVYKSVGLLGIVLFGVAAVTAIVMLPDIVRYVRIKTM